MKYAVIVSGGKQYRVTEGATIDVEHIPLAEKGAFSFDTVLLYRFEDTFLVGTPHLPQVSVKGSVVDNIKGKKIRVSTYKAKVRNRRVRGHRQHLTRIRVDAIQAGDEKKAETLEKPPRKRAAKTVKA